MNTLYNAINAERIDQKIRKQDISAGIGKMSTNTHIWHTIKSRGIPFVLVMKICKFLNLQLMIINQRKTRNNQYYIVDDKRDLYACINLEKEDFGLSNAQVAELVGAPSSRGNVWSKIKSSRIRYKHVVKICDELGLELIIRNPRKKLSYLLNTPKSKK